MESTGFSAARKSLGIVYVIFGQDIHVKFLALREAIVNAQATQSRTIKSAIQGVDSGPSKRMANECKLVAGGIIKWKPIDRAAAMMFAKANWLTRTPIESRPAKKDSMETGITSIRTPLGETRINLEEVTSRIVSERTKNANRAMKEADKEILETQESIGEQIRKVSNEMQDLLCVLQQHTVKVREQRMSVVADTDRTIRAMAEVRKFFLGSDYAKEMERLETFVRVCERMEELKRNGTIDAVSDIMLKLAP